MRTVLIAVLLLTGCATEGQMADWGTEIERDETTKQTGGSSILFNAEETGAIRGDYIPVIPGHPYHAFASIRDDDTGNADDKLHLYIEWRKPRSRRTTSGRTLGPTPLMRGWRCR